MITFTVEGDPVPKARPRVVNGRTYTPAKTQQAENRVKARAWEAGCRPHPSPVHISARFYRGTLRRCDLDNLVKTVLDGLNRVAFHDDDQVVVLTASKLLDRDNPRTEVEVRRLPDLEDAP